MMKTASVGTTSITNIQKYLLEAQRQESASFLEEMEGYAAGRIQLSGEQVGHLRDYLGQGSRGLAVDVSDDLSVRNWARQMDLTRILYQHDKPTKKGRSRSYYHFILSPNPNDDFTLATLREYSKAWCEENFRRGERLHEYAIVYHDDNAKGVFHAHIVVNVSNKKTGRKLHLDNDEAVALELSAQSIGKRFGLSPIREQMQETVGARTTQPVYFDRKEREILNKGGYSWKWELRKAISDIAPLSKDFDDFRQKMNRAGYDVERSEKTGYLTYKHRNGLKVKDSRLGSRFYIESLEMFFNQEQVLSDRAYTTWELIKISKGDASWKEDIRRAIDAVAPTVLSVPELQRELEKRYGIQVTLNRRGITYHHASGFKTRDIGLGCRYTLAGLRQNAVVGETLPYPAFEEIQNSGQFVSRHYIPRSFQMANVDADRVISAQAVYRDISRLMTRYGVLHLDDLSGALQGKYEALRELKTQLNDLRHDVMRWNHLTVLQSRFEKDHALLESGKIANDVELYNETLLRYKRIALYLREQTSGIDPKQKKEELSLQYEERLGSFQSELNQLQHDNAVYQNYLVGQSFNLPFNDESKLESHVDVRQLVAASQSLAKYHIRDYYHLEQAISEHETRLDLADFRVRKAATQKLRLEIIRNDIRSYEEIKPLLSSIGALRAHSNSLGMEAQEMQFKEVSRRLANAGVAEEDFDRYKEDYIRAMQGYVDATKERSRLSDALLELKDAQKACRAAAQSIQNSGLSLSLERNASSEGETIHLTSDVTIGRGSAKESFERFETTIATVEDIPFEEVRRRHRERAKQAPERSRKRNDWLMR